jgi:hypothetical protein
LDTEFWEAQIPNRALLLLPLCFSSFLLEYIHCTREIHCDNSK